MQPPKGILASVLSGRQRGSEKSVIGRRLVSSSRARELESLEVPWANGPARWQPRRKAHASIDQSSNRSIETIKKHGAWALSKKEESERRSPPGGASLLLAASHRWNTHHAYVHPPSTVGGMGDKRIWVLAADLMEFETGRDCVILHGRHSISSMGARVEIIGCGLRVVSPNARESECVGGRGAHARRRRKRWICLSCSLGIVQASIIKRERFDWTRHRRMQRVS